MNSNFVFTLLSPICSPIHSPACSRQWVVPLHGGTVGRSADCSWVIDDPDRVVSRQHARVAFEQSRCQWTDLGSNATLLNGKPLCQGQTVMLNLGDVLKIGDYRMTLGKLSDDWSSLAELLPVAEFDPLASLMPAEPAALSIDDLLESTSEEGASDNVHDEVPNLSVLGQRMYVGLQQASPACPNPTPAVPDMALVAEVEQLKALLKISVQGCMHLLQARRIFQQEMGGTLTTLSGKANNPLKFSATPEEALLRLLEEPTPAYLPAEQALNQAYQDILVHMQLSVEQAQAMIDQARHLLSPQSIQEEFSQSGSFTLGLTTSRKARLWDLYCERHARLGDTWS